ncbi:sce7726 family protein [Mycobacterium sp. NPDC003449]
MTTLQYQHARQLAQAFSTRVIRERSYQHRPLPLDRLQPLLDLVDDSAPLRDAFEAAYTLVRNNYRCEYIYKNTLVEGLTAADNAIIELPVQMSIADTVIINDTASAYEIKTDLDSFSRLELQLFSYSFCFEHVNVVTSEARAPRAAAEIPDHVGVLALTTAGELAVVRAARADYARLNQVAMFRVLRKDERLAILQRQLDYTIDAPLCACRLRSSCTCRSAARARRPAARSGTQRRRIQTGARSTRRRRCNRHTAGLSPPR